MANVELGYDFGIFIFIEAITPMANGPRDDHANENRTDHANSKRDDLVAGDVRDNAINLNGTKELIEAVYTSK